VLDLGAGYGGDLSKYEESEATRLYLVEPSEYNMVSLKGRLDAMNSSFRSKTTLIHAKGEEESIILPFLDNPVDVVSSFFSLTFLFESNLILGKFLDTVVHSLMEGGYFIGTMMEGSKTYRLLEKTKHNESVSLGQHDIQIIKQYENGQPAYGQAIQIHIKNSIVKDQTEYLAYFSLLEQEMKKRDCVLIKKYDFVGNERMSPYEIEFSQLNISFVFQYQPKRIQTISRSEIDLSYEFRNLFQETQVFVRTGVPTTHSFFHSFLYNSSPLYREQVESRNDKVNAIRNMDEMKLADIPAFMKEHDWNIYLIDTVTRKPIRLEGYVVSRQHSMMMAHFPDHSMEPIAVMIQGTAYRDFRPFDPILTHVHREMKRQ
jgi:hypothetical protein